MLAQGHLQLVPPLLREEVRFGQRGTDCRGHVVPREDSPAGIVAELTSCYHVTSFTFDLRVYVQCTLVGIGSSLPVSL